MRKTSAFEHDRSFLENERPSGVENMVNKIHYFYTLGREGRKLIILEEAAAYKHDKYFLENEKPSDVEKMVDKIHYFYTLGR